MSLPRELEPFAKRKVRCVMDNAPLFALAEIATPGKRHWTPSEWQEFLRDLNGSELTVEEWARKQELHRVDL